MWKPHFPSFFLATPRPGYSLACRIMDSFMLNLSDNMKYAKQSKNRKIKK